MIVLGKRHTFSEAELGRLKEAFGTIDFVSYRDQEPQATIEHLQSAIANGRKSLIVLNTVARIPDELLSYLISLESHGIRYLSIESFLERYLHKCYIPEDQTNADFLEKIQPLKWYQQWFKNAIDYPGALILGLIYLLILPFVKSRVAAQSPGPLLFEQDRVGLNNQEFTCIKFRSMRTDAEKDGAKFASENDDRIFPFGHTMRKTRIDEIPQFMNILKGEMSLIGPRPERRYWIEQFEKEIPYYNQRHLVKPGITGWAQVMYPYGANAEDARQKLMYDLYYIKHWSIALELKTIWKTIQVVLNKQGL